MPTTPFLWGGGWFVGAIVGWGPTTPFLWGEIWFVGVIVGAHDQRSYFSLDLPMLRQWGAQHFKLVCFSLVAVLRSEVTSPTGKWAAGSVGEGCGGWRGETVSRVICYCCLAIHIQGLRNLDVYGR